MLNRIIKFLGGYTKQEFSDLTKEYNIQRDLVTEFRAREVSLNNWLREEIADRKEIQKIIFKKFNILPEENNDSSFEDYQPIKSSSRRWSGLRSDLERDDRARVKGFTEELISDFKESKNGN
jgi:hypothetical protein